MSAGEQVLVVGLGNMGGAIARRLADVGRPVHGFDLNAAAVAAAADGGVTPVTSLAEGLSACSVVLTSLPDPRAVRAVYTGEEGLVGLISPGATVIELSTIDPFTMREVGELFATANPTVKVVDSPVSGGIEEASQGALSLMVGGADDAIDAAQPVLADIGTVRRCGGLGDAKVVKLVNNLVAISNVLGAVEALTLATSAGVDPDMLYDVLSNSGASSYQLNKRMPRMIADDLKPRFSLALAAKDLRLALELSEQLGLELSSARAVMHRFNDAEAKGWGALDMAAVAQFYPRNGDG